MIKIHGVESQYYQLLDELWDLDSVTEVNQWLGSLSHKDLHYGKLLVELVELSSIDSLVQDYNDCEEIREILRWF